MDKRLGMIAFALTLAATSGAGAEGTARVSAFPPPPAPEAAAAASVESGDNVEASPYGASDVPAYSAPERRTPKMQARIAVPVDAAFGDRGANALGNTGGLTNGTNRANVMIGARAAEATVTRTPDESRDRVQVR